MSQSASEALEEARRVIREQQEFIEQIKSAALITTSVVRVAPPWVYLLKDGYTIRAKMPKFPLVPGDQVLVHPGTGQIVEKSTLPHRGIVAIVESVIDEHTVSVSFEGQRITVFNNPLFVLQEGEAVLIDQNRQFVMKKLTLRTKVNVFTEHTNVTFDDIAGLDEAKRELTDAIILPHRNPDIFKFYNKKPPKGILLAGPPGCGKTMLAKAASTALRLVVASKGGSAKTKGDGFIYVKGPEILDMFVGVAEANIRRLFEQARQYKKDNGHPAILFIDEADAILSERGRGISTDMEKTIVPAFLAEMDGLADSGAIVLLATNRPEQLDAAVTRDGRIDRKITVTRPTAAAAVQLFDMTLKRVPLDTNVSREQMSANAVHALYAEDRVLFKIKTKDQKMHMFAMKNIVNGGMIVNIVDQATSIALHRDLNANSKSGVKLQDLYQAIDAAQRQNLELNHREEVEAFVANHGGGAEYDSLHAV